MRTVPWLVRLASAGVLATLELWGQKGLAEASLEQLLDVQVTTVSKKEQKLARTAAAVFVLGAEEIRRSGALTLPDLLRLVPGVQVAQIDASAWAISIRGFNSGVANEVQVNGNWRTDAPAPTDGRDCTAAFARTGMWGCAIQYRGAEPAAQRLRNTPSQAGW